MTLDEGTNSDVFEFLPNQVPPPALCPGAGPDGHRWQTFMTPTSVDPGTLTYGPDGPVPVGSEFTQPMWSAGTPIINGNPATAPAGLIVGTPATFDFTAYDATFVPPAGDYYVGYACTLAGATTRFWASEITITAGPSPALFSWALQAPSPTTTTSTTSTTTTSIAGGTTTSTTTAGTSTTSTTVAGGSTTSTTIAGSSTTRPASAQSSSSGSGSGSSGASQSLATTGSSTWSFAVWALLALVIGRIVLLTARRTKVLPADRG
jgi:hypothetical protein